MATTKAAAGEEEEEEQASPAPSSAAGKPGPERRACRLGKAGSRRPGPRDRMRPLKCGREGRVASLYKRPPPPRPPFRLASPQATPKGRRAPAPTSNQLRSLRRRPPQRAKPRPLATRAAMKKPRSEKPCPQSVPLTYRTGSVTAETRRGP